MQDTRDMTWSSMCEGIAECELEKCDLSPLKIVKAESVMFRWGYMVLNVLYIDVCYNVYRFHSAL